ncbi:unnamed protein product [Amoebophrya sp. A25]|nr:unnamed protein product [Amoebophrya sp. A25]|eukprot:GSA25T00007466001.1
MSATGDDGQLGISSSAQIREEAMQRLAATTRPGESEFNPNFPSFAVALLAHGVNPHDIEGDIVENQADRPEVFDSILKNLQSGHDYSAMTTNVSREEFSTLLNGPNALRTRSKDGGGGGAVSSTSTSASSRPAPASRGGVSALQRNRSQSAAGQKGKGKATGSKGVGGISSGSDSEEDFAKARAKVKQHSESKLVGGSSLSTSSSTTTMRPTSGGFRPPARSTASNILQQEQAKHKESPEKVDQVGQEGKDEQNEEEEDHQDADDTTAQPEDRLKKQQPLMRSNRRSAFSKLSKEEELLIAGGFGAGFIDEYDHTDDLSEGAKKKVAEIEAFLKRGKPDQPSMQQLQKAIAEDKALMSQVTKAKNVGKASLENDENGNASTDQPERLLPREEPRGDVLRDISSAVANRTPSISPEPVQKVNSGSAVDKASLLNADRVIEAGGDGAGTIQRNVVESSGDAQALLANLKKFRNGREENTDPAERRASLSKEEQRRQDEDEKRRFAEECERRRVMLQERMRGLDQVLATSDRVHEHVANLQRLESSSRDQVLVLKGTRTGGSPRMLSSKTGSPKVNKSSPKRASFLDYADSYDRDATASTAASTRAQGTDATEETERKGGSSSSQEEVGETIEVDTKLLEEVAGRRYNFPLVHFAGSRSQQLDLAPAGFVSMAMGMNTKLYLLPYASEERPLPSEKTLQILSAVAVCQAAVLLLVDGVSLQNAESASSRRSDMQYYGLYVLIAAPERKVLRQLQDEASRVEIDEAPKQGIRPRAPDFAKEADKLQEAPFLPIEADDWHPVLTRSFGFGPHLVGSYAKEEEFSDDEKLDRHYTATDGALTKGGFYEQACVVVVRKPDLLGELVRQGTQRGLYLCGLRTVYPSASEIEKCCSILKQHLRASQRNVIAALRGPDCLEILREIVGPSPEIARQTDPTSLNARFGGIHSTHVVSPPARGQVDLVWAFGGRAQDIQPKEPLGRQDMAAHLKTALRNTAVTHAFHVFPEQVYCVALRHALAPKDLVTRLGLFLRHFGRVLSVNPQRVKLEGMGSLSTFTVTAVREAGTGFLQPLRQQSGSLYEHVFSELPMETYGLRVRNLDQNHAFSAPPRTEDQVDVCVTLLPLLPGVQQYGSYWSRKVQTTKQVNPDHSRLALAWTSSH